MNKTIAFTVALLATTASFANADTLYVAPPANVAPGHPLRLGPDHRAQQVGDIVNVVFAFSATDSESDTTTTSKSFTAGANQGSNNAIKLFNIINVPTAIGGNSGDSYSKTHAITNTFTTTMMATVVDVLPSGALAIAGDQQLVVDGIAQKVHITGVIRQEDIDDTDSIPSTRIANAQAKFDGNFRAKNAGIIQRIMDFLF